MSDTKQGDPREATGRMYSKTTTRVRRGRVVEIPEKWRGVVTDKQTIRKRDSKATRKGRLERGDWRRIRERQEARAPKVDEWA